MPMKKLWYELLADWDELYTIHPNIVSSESVNCKLLNKENPNLSFNGVNHPCFDSKHLSSIVNKLVIKTQDSIRPHM